MNWKLCGRNYLWSNSCHEPARGKPQRTSAYMVLRQSCGHGSSQVCSRKDSFSATHTLFGTMNRVLVNNQRDAQILFSVFISIYNSLHVSRTRCSSLGETNCINTASGNSHSMLVAEMCAGSNLKRICASRWSFTKNHYMMHSQQNVK